MQHSFRSAGRPFSKRNGIIAGIVVIALVTAGYLFVRSQAAGFFASVDPSRGMVRGTAKIVTDPANGQILQFGPTPTPPPPAGSAPITFGRFLYVADARNNYQTQATRWGWHGLQGNHTKDLKGIKAINKSTIVTVYASPGIIRMTDLDGHTTAVQPTTVTRDHPDWILKDASGNPLRRGADDDYAVDIGNVDYQKASLQFLLDKVNRDGWDGVNLDEINPTPSHSFPGPRPAKYPDNTSWKNAMFAYVKYVCGGLQQNGKSCYINLGATDDWARNIALLTNGAEVEFFVAMDPRFTPTEAATIENGLWKPQIAWAEWMEKNLQQPQLHAATVKGGLADYAMGSYLLVSQGKGVFSSSLEYGNDGNVYTAAMDNAKKLGSPKAAYVEDKSGIWYRDFQNGRVLVNPHNGARTFNGQTLQATTAQLLLN